MPKKQATGKTESQTETTTKVSVPEESSAPSTTTDSSTNDNRVVGCVKWFDHQKGYGFVTQISSGDHHGEDIFVHQSNINTKEDTYRILYDGETVMFDLQVTDGEKHPYQAVNVTGYQDISLQCENKAIHRSVRRNNSNNGNNNGRNGGGNRYNGNNSNNRHNGGRSNGNNRQRSNEPTEEV